MAVFTDSTRLPIGQATVLTESELLALFDRGAGIDKLVERLIDIMDAADAPSEDLEDGHDAELDFEGEATLGAPEQHHNQSKWGRTQVDGDGELELSLGAPERHPPHADYSGIAGPVRGGGDAQTIGLPAVAASSETKARPSRATTCPKAMKNGTAKARTLNRPSARPTIITTKPIGRKAACRTRNS